MAVADRIAVMEAGRIVQIGTPDEIYRYPVSAFVASFIGRSNILNGKADGMEVATEFGKLPLSRAANGAVMLSVRHRTDHAGSGPGWLCLCGWARISRAMTNCIGCKRASACLQVIFWRGGHAGCGRARAAADLRLRCALGIGLSFPVQAV